MSLTKLDLAHPDQTAELAEKVIRKLRAGMMPPPGLPRPGAPAVKAFVGTLGNGIDQAAAVHPNPGRPALHRLNRTEYANSVRDLLDRRRSMSAPLLPTDDMSHGFDNMADVLTISPALMEGYIRAAGQISREAVGDTGALALTDDLFAFPASPRRCATWTARRSARAAAWPWFTIFRPTASTLSGWASITCPRGRCSGRIRARGSRSRSR